MREKHFSQSHLSVILKHNFDKKNWQHWYFICRLTQTLMSNRNICLLSLNASMKHAKLIYQKNWMNGNGSLSTKGLFLIYQLSWKTNAKYGVFSSVNYCEFFLVLIIMTADDKHAIFLCFFFFTLFSKRQVSLVLDKYNTLCNQKFCAVWYT